MIKRSESSKLGDAPVVLLSPDFGQIRRWAVSEDGLEGRTRGASSKRPCAKSLGLTAYVSVIY